VKGVPPERGIDAVSTSPQDAAAQRGRLARLVRRVREREPGVGRWVAAGTLAALTLAVALPSNRAAAAADASPEANPDLSRVPDPDVLEASGEPCPPSTAKPRSGALGYRRRGALCEGLYESPVAADFEVVSLLSADLSSAGEREIVIGAPELPGVASDVPVRVTALALRPRTYYRMDAAVPAGGSLRWPVGEVLGPLGLDASDLGVYGQVEIGGETVYVPLRPLGGRGATSPRGRVGGLPQAEVELVVRAGVDVETVAWRSSPVGAAPQGLESRRERAAAGEPIRIALPLPKPGLQRVEIQLKPSEEDDWLSRVFVVAVPEPR
jgi:hypothetical protein